MKENLLEKYLVEGIEGWEDMVLKALSEPKKIVNKSTLGASGTSFSVIEISEYLGLMKQFPEKTATPNQKVERALVGLVKKGKVNKIKSKHGMSYSLKT